MQSAATLEALLFAVGKPVRIEHLAKSTGISKAQAEEALRVLEKDLERRGIRLMRKDDEVMLSTAPEYASLIEGLRKEELEGELGKAAFETLAIVLYRGPLSRSEIDYIRGVNSTFMLRSLMIRGLVERIPNPKDSRGYLYRPTLELLSHLGITAIEKLPRYEEFKKEIRAFIEAEEQKEEGGAQKEE